MRRFDFRLDRIIEVREVKKRECQRELAKSQRELLREEELLQQAQAQSEASREGLRQALKKSAQAGLLAALDGWRKKQEAQVQNQAQRTLAQRREMEQRRNDLIKADQEKRILDRLKEHAVEDYQAECRKEEQAFLDELGCRIGRIYRRKS
jgi:flagellar FliJ protein